MTSYYKFHYLQIYVKIMYYLIYVILNDIMQYVKRDVIISLQSSLYVFDGLVSVKLVFQLVQFSLVVVQERLDIWLSLLQMFQKIFQLML